MKSSQGVRESAIQEVRGGKADERFDRLAVEEPLEIRLSWRGDGRLVERSVAVTMRTPGHDVELALGFLRTEGVVSSRQDIEFAQLRSNKPACNVVRVRLRPGVEFDPARVQRNFYTTSSCGVCSKASLEALKIVGCRRLEKLQPQLSARTVQQLPLRMRQGQSVFAQTGGLHAAALFDGSAKLLSLHEDVGRHNALDKVVGEQFQSGRLPLSEHVLMVSGRSSFEILQKALAAGIPVVAAVGAPSTLAVETAREYGMTLLGFVRGKRFNIYAGDQRLSGLSRR